MIKINKFIEPEEFSNFKRRNKSYRCWDDYSCTEGKEMKKILKESMLEEQDKYCPYCERKIEGLEQGHIEHIKPRAHFPQYFQNYENLLVSCENLSTCGRYKGSNYHIDLFINPVFINPEEFFSYNLATGEIEPKVKSNNEKKMAEYTIEILNLNQNKLKAMRIAMIIKITNTIKGYEGAEVLDFFYGANFPTLVNYLKDIDFYQLVKNI